MELMFNIVVIFLGTSLLLYCLFGGADFGAGILELFSSKQLREKEEKITYNAIAPIWEANHMWLVLVVVILFMGFPGVYTELSVSFHIPITAMLIGIVLRGCFFTFRHYDPFMGRSHTYYSVIFIFSSIWTSLFLGIIAGGLILGRIDPTATGFAERFVWPWLNFFSFSIGLFTCCIFSFLAAVFLIGETKEEQMRTHLLKQAKYVTVATVICGGLVFVSSEIENFHLFSALIHHSVSFVCIVLATIALPLLWLVINKRMIIWPRLLAGFQICMILLAWTSIQFPVIVKVKTGNDLTLSNSHAPEATLTALGWALLVGSLLILPALYYLMRSFKHEPDYLPNDVNNHEEL